MSTPAPAGTLLSNADFVVQDRDSVLTRASVFVRGEVIEDVGAAEELARSHPDAAVVDCRGCIVHPGLVNAHNHLYQVLLRGLGKRFELWEWLRRVTYPVARGLRAEDHYHACLLACMDAIRNGTTAVVDMPTHHARHHADEALRALRETGLRGAVAVGMSDRFEIDEGEGRSPDEELRHAEGFLERWATPGIARPWLGPSGFHSTSPELLQQAKALATARGTRLHVHLAEVRASVPRAAAAGHEGEVAWALDLGLLDSSTLVAHAVWMQPGEHGPLAATGAQVVHNPVSNQLLAAGAAPVTRMRAAGVPVALGTDGPASNDALDLYPEMKAAVLLQRVTTLDPQAFTAQDAFELCTEGGARALGIDRLGKLRPGYLADVTAVQAHDNPRLTPVYNPIESLVLQACGRDVVLTMVNGRLLYERGRFATVDEHGVLGEARRIQREIAARHPELLTATADPRAGRGEEESWASR
jgi:5-methylthioadenosine/S-adenosylhomocysteine deaminase